MKQVKLFSALLLLCAVLFSCGGGSEGVDSQMIPFSTDDFKTVYLDQKGKTVLEVEGKSASYFSNGLASFTDSETELKGFINKKGKVVIEAQFSKANNFSEGIAWVTKPNGHIEAINTKGKTVFILEDIYSVMDFREGMATFEKFNEEGKRLYGVINKKGKVVIEPTENEIGYFRHGIAIYVNDYNHGFIDQKGKIIINPQFDQVFVKGNKDLIAVKMGKWGVINRKGEYIINPRYHFIAPDGNMFIYTDDSRQIGWCNKKGEAIITPQFDDANLFVDNDLALVMSGRKRGYVDKKGKLTIPYQFDNATSFIDNNVAIVEVNDKYGLIDKKGKYIVNPTYSYISSDFFQFAFEGYLKPETIVSDYLAIEETIASVSAIINNEYIDGDLYLAPLEVLMKKYDLKEEKFSRYSKTMVSLKKGRVDNFVDYELYVNEYPFKRVPSGWSYTYRFDDNHPVRNYVLIYTLNSAKREKTGDLAKEIIRHFSSNPSSDFRAGHVHSDYDNHKQYAISYSGADITIKITQLEDQTTAYEAIPASSGSENFAISISDKEWCDGGDITLTIRGGKPFADASKPFKVENKLRSGAEVTLFVENFKHSNGVYTAELGSRSNDESEQTLIVTDAEGKTQTIDFKVVNCP